jgi:hypothetical protein
MRNRKLRGRFRHAAMLGDGEQDMKVAQSDAASDTICPIHGTLLAP